MPSEVILRCLITVRNEVAKVMFSQACVCRRGGAWSQGDAWSRGEGLVPGGLVPGGVCSRGSGPGGVGGSGPRGSLVPGGVGIPACTEADPLGEMATAADGTHPTGMHSC